MYNVYIKIFKEKNIFYYFLKIYIYSFKSEKVKFVFLKDIFFNLYVVNIIKDNYKEKF